MIYWTSTLVDVFWRVTKLAFAWRTTSAPASLRPNTTARAMVTKESPQAAKTFTMLTSIVSVLTYQSSNSELTPSKWRSIRNTKWPRRLSPIMQLSAYSFTHSNMPPFITVHIQCHDIIYIITPTRFSIVKNLLLRN